MPTIPEMQLTIMRNKDTIDTLNAESDYLRKLIQDELTQRAKDSAYEEAVRKNNGRIHETICECDYCHMVREDFAS